MLGLVAVLPLLLQAFIGGATSNFAATASATELEVQNLSFVHASYDFLVYSRRDTTLIY